MDPDRTDLLPIERQRAHHRAYLFRLGTVTMLTGAGLFVIAAALLLPERALLSRERAAHEEQLSAVETALASTADKALAQQLSSLENDLKTLSALGSAPKSASIIAEALGTARPNVVLTGFTYTPNAKRLDITGIAADRASLQAYQAALQAAPFATSADLPVSAYAKAADIPFTISVTLTP